MSDVSDDAIAKAIESVDYRYFGDYPLSDGQWDAVTTLCLAAKELTSARSEIARLREALKPFADAADAFPNDTNMVVARVRITDDFDAKIIASDLHRARSALSLKGE